MEKFYYAREENDLVCIYCRDGFCIPTLYFPLYYEEDPLLDDETNKELRDCMNRELTEDLSYSKVLWEDEHTDSNSVFPESEIQSRYPGAKLYDTQSPLELYLERNK